MWIAQLPSRIADLQRGARGRRCLARLHDEVLGPHAAGVALPVDDDVEHHVQRRIGMRALTEARYRVQRERGGETGESRRKRGGF
jgi:hypothetical protein